MSTKPDFRKVILDRLEELGQNRLWLVNESGIGKAHVYGYLAGNVDMTGDKLEVLFDALGLTISPSSTTKAARKKPLTPPDMPL